MAVVDDVVIAAATATAATTATATATASASATAANLQSMGDRALPHSLTTLLTHQQAMGYCRSSLGSSSD